MSKYLTASLLIITLLVGIGIGYFLTPEYATMQNNRENTMMELGKADRYVDLRFIDGMIGHHYAAIYLLTQVQEHSKRPELQQLADVVIDIDTKGIAHLYTLKKTWYNDTRKITQYPKVHLGNADEKFDLRFLNAMIAHHEEAITVSKDALTKSSRTQTLQTATDVIQLLSTNLKQLKKWRGEWYGIN